MKDFIKDFAPIILVILTYVVLTSVDRFTLSTDYERDAIIISILVTWFLILMYNIAKALEIILNKIDEKK